MGGLGLGVTVFSIAGIVSFIDRQVINLLVDPDQG
jgi:hypothetical protein